MTESQGWFMCRIGFVETVRAVELAAGPVPVKSFREEWQSFAVIEVNQALVDRAATLAVNRGLRSLDSLHLAAALLVRAQDLVLATWDERLHAAGRAEGLRLLPASLT
jgi:predicted nucleic acid-binding protein